MIKYIRCMDIRWVLKDFPELTLQEFYDMMVLRQEVFIVEQDCPYLDADGKDLKSHHLFGWDADNKLVAYLRIVKPGVSYEEASLGRIVSSLSVRRTGVGKLLMEESIKQVKKLYGKVPLRISAQSYLLPFYGKFGFVPVGQEYLEDDIPHTQMYRP